MVWGQEEVEEQGSKNVEEEEEIASPLYFSRPCAEDLRVRTELFCS